MIIITHKFTCSLPSCNTEHEENYEYTPNITATIAFYPKYPDGWTYVPGTGYVCDKHRVSVKVE